MTLNIDDTDRKILFEWEKNARIPDVKIAKIVKKSKDAVRYRIKKLEELEIITGYKTWIDISRLGYRAATIYLTLLNLPDRKDNLIKNIEKDKRVYWLGISEGVWNIGISYFIKSNEELFKIKNNLLSNYKDLILETNITSLVSVSLHEKTFLTKEKSSLITFSKETKPYQLDTISKLVLNELYNNSKANIAHVAHKCNTTVDVVKNRMKKLEKESVIIRYTTSIDYQKIGYEFYKSFIYLKSYNEEELNEILKYAENSDTIINIVKQVAPWDFEFILFAKSFQEYNNAISKLTQKFSKTIKKIETATMSQDIIFPCQQLIFS